METVPGEDDLWLETEVEIEPEKNTQWAAQRIFGTLRPRLSGLYFSGSMYCTQMEAEGAELTLFLTCSTDIYPAKVDATRGVSM